MYAISIGRGWHPSSQCATWKRVVERESLERVPKEATLQSGTSACEVSTGRIAQTLTETVRTPLWNLLPDFVSRSPSFRTGTKARKVFYSTLSRGAQVPFRGMPLLAIFHIVPTRHHLDLQYIAGQRPVTTLLGFFYALCRLCLHSVVGGACNQSRYRPGKLEQQISDTKLLLQCTCYYCNLPGR